MFTALTRHGEVIGTATMDYDADLRCPDCLEPVIAKRGEVVEHHFAHAHGYDWCIWHDTDMWHEPMTRWHRGWQRWFAHAGCATEVTFEDRYGHSRRADIVCPDGLIVEVQHSKIDVAQIRAREAFWRPMLWLWDATWVMSTVQDRDGIDVARLGWRDGREPGWHAGPSVRDDAHENREFRWRRPWHSCARAVEPTFWDCGPLGIWWVALDVERRDWGDRSWWTVTGFIMKRMDPEEFVMAALDGRWSGVAGDEPRRVSGMLRSVGIGSTEVVRQRAPATPSLLEEF
jgi:hypothetical protein